jgi:hypothetical protein
MASPFNSIQWRPTVAWQSAEKHPAGLTPLYDFLPEFVPQPPENTGIKDVNGV